MERANLCVGFLYKIEIYRFNKKKQDLLMSFFAFYMASNRFFPEIFEELDTERDLLDI